MSSISRRCTTCWRHPCIGFPAATCLALRLFSILIGLASLILLYLCLELIFTNKTLITVGAYGVRCACCLCTWQCCRP